MVMGRMNVKKM